MPWVSLVIASEQNQQAPADKGQEHECRVNSNISNISKVFMSQEWLP